MPVDEAFVCPELTTSAEAARALDALRASGAALFEVTRPVFERLAFGDRSDGLVAVAETPSLALERLEVPPGAVIAVLEAVEKPGNAGAVMRSADAAGVAAVIAADARTDLFNPNAIRASLGTIFALPVAAASGTETVAWLRRRGDRIHAARVDGSVPYTSADFRGGVALVLGSEAGGLSEVWSGDDITNVSLPMLGIADSLNVSATAAVLFYEALRQRTAEATTAASRATPAGDFERATRRNTENG